MLYCTHDEASCRYHSHVRPGLGRGLLASEIEMKPLIEGALDALTEILGLVLGALAVGWIYGLF